MIPEILDGCGVLVPPGDSVALAGALKRLLDDPGSAEEIGRRARARCQAHYSFASARAALFPVVERALGTRPR
jgi:glycosyltransferase involved in cell wall biosynthesis